MPTGYTASVAEGRTTDLRTFALECARGMGALIMMRDEPSDAPIPERFEPSPYAANRLEEARAERLRLYALSDEECEAAALAEFEAKTAEKAKWWAEKQELRARYRAMIEKVEAWQRAPDGLKEFMLDQLQLGMEFDCRDGPYWDEPERLDGAEWRRGKLAKVERDILHNSVEDAKERERTEGRNVWLAQLRLALSDTDRSGEAGETRSKARPKARAGAAASGIAQKTEQSQ